jgi:hypothetical protein
LVAESLPLYAPDLNPVETLWANLKRQELANLATVILAGSWLLRTAGSNGSAARGGWPYAFARRCGIYFW